MYFICEDSKDASAGIKVDIFLSKRMIFSFSSRRVAAYSA